MTKKQIIRSCLSANIGGRGTQNYGFTNKYVYNTDKYTKKNKLQMSCSCCSTDTPGRRQS